MSEITFQKPIYFIESFEDKNLIEDYKIKFDYIITIFISKEKNIINGTLNKNNNYVDITLKINKDELNNIFDRKSSLLKEANPDCISIGINNNMDTLTNRIYEILSIKLFGDARFKTVFENNKTGNIYKLLSEQFLEIINLYRNDLLNFHIKDLNSTPIEQIQTIFDKVINETNILIPFNFSGELLDLEEALKVLFESTCYGGSKINDGKYNIPLLLEIKRTV